MFILFLDKCVWKYEYTLEHVIPQKWQEYWSVYHLPVLDEQGNEIKDNSEAEKRNQDVY